MNANNKIWAVAYVWRGIPNNVKLFLDEEGALHYIEQARKAMSREDSIDLFLVDAPNAVNCTTA